jgi:antitoxin HigA-1
MRKTSDPISPGYILERDFMVPLGLTVQQLARDLHVPVNVIAAVVAGRRAVGAELALRLGRYFGVNPETWLVFQAQYELRLAERQLGGKIDRTVAPLEAA